MATTSADLRAGALVAPPGAPQGDAELLAWLRDSPPEAIATEQGLVARPDHLLYLVARHAVLLTYASVATQIQLAGGDTAPAGRAGDRGRHRGGDASPSAGGSAGRCRASPRRCTS